MQKSIRFSEEATSLVESVVELGDFGYSFSSVVESCVKRSLETIYKVEIATVYEHGEVSSQWHILPFQLMILLEEQMELRNKKNRIIGELIQKGYELEEINEVLTRRDIRVSVLDKVAYKEEILDSFIASNFYQTLETFENAKAECDKVESVLNDVN